MKEISFKIKDNKLNIIVDKDLSNSEFLSLLNERLEQLVILKDSLKNEVILNIENRCLNNREILNLFDILNEVNIFYISKIICKNKSKQNLTIYKGNLRSGQIRFFDKSLLFIGCLNKGSKLIVDGDLYVLGTINGDIELKDKYSKIYCENISESLIKIGDIYKLYSDEMNSKEIYLQDNKIKERDYKKGEFNYGKSNSCYIR